jgi:hypothetical protein
MNQFRNPLTLVVSMLLLSCASRNACVIRFEAPGANNQLCRQLDCIHTFQKNFSKRNVPVTRWNFP